MAIASDRMLLRRCDLAAPATAPRRILGTCARERGRSHFRVHAATIENALGIEAVLDPCAQARERRVLRLEDRYRAPQLGAGANQRGMATLASSAARIRAAPPSVRRRPPATADRLPSPRATRARDGAPAPRAAARRRSGEPRRARAAAPAAAGRHPGSRATARALGAVRALRSRHRLRASACSRAARSRTDGAGPSRRSAARSAAAPPPRGSPSAPAAAAGRKAAPPTSPALLMALRKAAKPAARVRGRSSSVVSCSAAGSTLKVTSVMAASVPKLPANSLHRS